MSTRPVKGYKTDFGVFLVEQQPVGANVALPVALIVSVQQMVVVFLGQGFALLQETDYFKQFLDVKPSANGQLHVAVVLLVGSYFVVLLHRLSIAFLKSSNVAYVVPLSFPLRTSSMVFMVFSFR